MLSAGLVSLALLFAQPSAALAQRKSLAWGWDKPHAKFVVDPVTTASFLGEEADPFDVAVNFLNGHAGEAEWRIREDSYTDKATGVTHIYVKQLFDGLDVVDGDINLNIKDGVVLSYGDEFYHVPSKLHARDQIPLVNPGISGPIDPREALAAFMAAATPNDLLSDEINRNFDDVVSKMDIHVEHSFTGDGQPIFHIHNVPDAVNPVKSKLGYIQSPEGLKLVYKFEVEMENNWYEAAIETTPPYAPLSIVDWAADSPAAHLYANHAPVPKEPETKKGGSYLVFPWGVNDPSEGERAETYENFDALASPLGWHSIPEANVPSGIAYDKGSGSSIINFTTTIGNNVFAHENWEGRNSWIDNRRPDAGKSLNFTYTYDPQDSTDSLTEARKYINATITQLFHTSNLVHDLFYRYGFDEVSGNFQQHNFGRGGAENDAVITNAQDGSGYNNANFMTPPDGTNGRCRMYLWNTATPYRDGDLEAGIVIHELAHGLSTRLTGGPKDSGCLGWGESGGMGEGWGDFLATIIRNKENYTDWEVVYPMGSWAANREKGIRNYPYSLNKTVNPSTYKTLDRPGYFGVHAIGEVWAEILWIVSQRLVQKHGFSESLFPPKPEADGSIPIGDFYRPPKVDAKGKPGPLVPKHGNTLIVQLVLNGMKLQKCRPDFFDARDAIIQADNILTGGENFCELWNAFAERGLGPDATVKNKTPWGGGVRKDGFAVPSKCLIEEPEPEEPDY